MNVQYLLRKHDKETNQLILEDIYEAFADNEDDLNQELVNMYSEPEDKSIYYVIHDLWLDNKNVVQYWNFKAYDKQDTIPEGVDIGESGEYNESLSEETDICETAEEPF